MRAFRTTSWPGLWIGSKKSGATENRLPCAHTAMRGHGRSGTASWKLDVGADEVRPTLTVACGDCGNMVLIDATEAGLAEHVPAADSPPSERSP